MNNEQSTPIRGGYILFARQFVELLADMPLLDRALWVWLYCKANHKDYAGLARGELLTTINEMQDAMSYSYGCAKKVPSKDDIRRAIGRLHRRRMIAKRKTTHGHVVTICDYNSYQNPDNYDCRQAAAGCWSLRRRSGPPAAIGINLSLSLSRSAKC